MLFVRLFWVILLVAGCLLWLLIGCFEVGGLGVRLVLVVCVVAICLCLWFV